MTSNQTPAWVSKTIISKARYDIMKSASPDIQRLEDYIRDNGFIATAQLRSNGTACHIWDAQRRFANAFRAYHSSDLRKQCFKDGRVTRRNKKYQPLAFMAFDIEGSRHNGFSTTTVYPHGHGIVLFHERTLTNFKDANREFLTLEGGYIISNPTTSISLIDLKPVDSFEDFDRFLAYSLKLEARLRDSDTNYAPYDFYPGPSVDFPFWSALTDVAASAPHVSICKGGYF